MGKQRVNRYGVSGARAQDVPDGTGAKFYLRLGFCRPRRRRDAGRNQPHLFVTLDKPHDRLTVAGVQYMLRQLGRRAEAENTHPHRFRNPNLDKIQTFLWKASELAVPPT